MLHMIEDTARHCGHRDLWREATDVRGHEKVPAGGQEKVPAGGQVEVPTPCSSCRAGAVGPSSDGGGV
ncbi:MAG: DUF664 domain-containing protein [Propionibacteriaceae bacterium]